MTSTFYVKLNVIVRPNAGPCKILPMHQESGLNDVIATKARRRSLLTILMVCVFTCKTLAPVLQDFFVANDTRFLQIT